MDGEAGFPWLFSFWFFSVIWGVAAAAMSHDLAKHKGHNPGMAAMTGLFFSWLSVVYYAGLPDRSIANTPTAVPDLVQVTLADGQAAYVPRSAISTPQ